jgi:hypothetical protein
LEPHIGYC